MIAQTLDDEIKNDNELLDECETKPRVTIICCDKKSFSIEKKLLNLSGFLNAVLENDPSTTKIVLNENISSYSAGKIIDYLTHYELYPQKSLDFPLYSSCLETLVGKWYSDFAECNCDINQVFDVLFVANYLCIHPLVKLMSVHISLIMKKKNIHQIKELFTVKKQ